MSSDIFWRNEAGYEQARRDAVANGRKPDRFPDVIVRARTVDDVISAVRIAQARNLKVGIRSGGHSWAASFLRDGGMLLDLSQMSGFSVDVNARTAIVQPGVKGGDLNRALLKDRLELAPVGTGLLQRRRPGRCHRRRRTGACQRK
jgi:FAD/FMN-containing dehydrogenase